VNHSKSEAHADRAFEQEEAVTQRIVDMVAPTATGILAQLRLLREITRHRLRMERRPAQPANPLDCRRRRATCGGRCGMNAPDREPRNGREAAFIRAFRLYGPRGQRAILDAIIRVRDGQPMIESAVEFYIELGDPPALARRRAREVLQGDRGDWRALCAFPEPLRATERRAPQGPAETVSSYALRHSHITAQLLAGLPVQLVAKLHDTSASQIEKHYVATIASHTDDLVRASMMEVDRPAAEIVPIRMGGPIHTPC
jgi:hypothetical protein